ncbi:MAG TPA: hypothetical protein VLG49_00635 [Rhabdochlamydiaceae bacterium]|nr:hypothetical protein [Rhabdochlamydiaceae bacterium]
MLSVSFSLSEKVIIDPVLTLRSSLPPVEPGQSVRFRAKVWHVIQSEVLARSVAIFASIFAVADASTHLLVGIYKRAHPILRNVCHLHPATWNHTEVHEHFQRAAWFVRLTILGSLTGMIRPDVFTFFRYSPSPPPLEHDENTPEAHKLLAHRVETGKEQAPFKELRQFWKQGSLENKHWFVHTFSRDGSENLKSVRKNLADIVYKPVTRSLHERQIQWLSSQEVDQRINSSWDRANAFNRAFLFHATSEHALESILKSRKVEVRHEKAFRGAFVSTRPEVGFGRCILAFKRNIERLSSLEHGFTINQNTYWAGFSHDIPVTDTTLAYLILDGGDDRECKELQDRIAQWTGRSINVISLRNVANKLDAIEHLGMGIPSEWPEEGAHTGQKILTTLRARAAVAVQHKVPQPQLVHT